MERAEQFRVLKAEIRVLAFVFAGLKHFRTSSEQRDAVEGVAVLLGEKDVVWVKTNQSGQGGPPIHRATGSHPTSQERSPTSGGDSRSASYSVDYVHQVRITQGVGDGG